jgi:hypothetical protein
MTCVRCERVIPTDTVKLCALCRNLGWRLDLLGNLYQVTKGRVSRSRLTQQEQKESEG